MMETLQLCGKFSFFNVEKYEVTIIFTANRGCQIQLDYYFDDFSIVIGIFVIKFQTYNKIYLNDFSIDDFRSPYTHRHLLRIYLLVDS